jgi:hypothetical protein
MSDNTTLPPGSGGDNVRTIDRAGVKTQVIAIDIGGEAGPENLAAVFPISATALPLPTGAATGAKQDTGNTSVASIDTKTPALGQALAAASSPVVLTALQVTALTPPAAITGFALEAGHLATIDTSTAKIPAQGQALAAASTPVVLTAIQVTALTPPAAITGFALEAGHIATIDAHTPALGQALAAASVPVVLTAAQITTLTPLATVALGAGAAVIGHVIVDSGTVTAVTAITNALPAGTNLLGKVGIDQTTPGTTNAVVATGPTLTKATQGATGFSVQDLKDAGRVALAITCYQAAGIITTEALFAAATFSRSADGAAATTGIQFTVTAGKRFRVQSISVAIKNNAAAAGTSKLVLRYAAAGGTITNASPIVAILDMGSNSATIANYIGPFDMVIPDGFEMLAAATFGFTSLVSAVTMLHTITMLGYEY